MPSARCHEAGARQSESTSAFVVNRAEVEVGVVFTGVVQMTLTEHKKGPWLTFEISPGLDHVQLDFQLSMAQFCKHIV